MIGAFIIASMLGWAASPLQAQATEPQKPSTTTSVPAQEQPWPPEGAVRMSPDVKAPEVIKEVKPRYTAEAMRAKIQGIVEMEAVVMPDGSVGPVRVKKSLDSKLGLDDAAIAAVKGWLFKPGTKDGVAVPVVVDIELSFVIRDKK